MNIYWLSSLWVKNADRKTLAIDERCHGEKSAFENSRHEFMFDNLMDVPFERIGMRSARPLENR